MNKVVLGLIALVLIIAGGWFVIREPAVTPEATSLSRVPDFSLKDYNQQTVSLADFAGKPLVINSWAAWCPFCKQELPDFAALQKELGDKIVIIAIDRAEPLQTAKRYSDETGVTPENLILLLDPDDSFYQAIGGFSMPETIFVSREGKIMDHKRGPMPLEEMRERAKKIL